MSKRPLVSKEDAEQILSYDPETGIFTWKRTAGRAKKGAAAGHLNSRGYIEICIHGRLYRAHRLAFLFMTGNWPQYGVDHIDGVKNNNRWANLRDIPDAINIQNKREPRSDRKDKDMPLGVSRIMSGKNLRFKASLSLNRKTIQLGLYKTPEEAQAAYLAGKRKYHEGCTI